jgi:arabinogalactan oligomer / maltooligosaccharide transport system substrate-binding protein
VRGRVLRLAAVAVGLLLAAGCTAPSGPSQTGPTDPASGTLVWWDISTQTGATAAMQSLISTFELSYPHVKVTYVQMTPQDAEGRFDTAAQAASGAPDVITLESIWIANFAQRGYLERLDDTPADDGFADTFPSVLPTLKWDGRTYAAPQSADGMALLYNRALLARAGLAPPKTWAQVSADRLKLTALGVQTLYAQANGEALLPWIYGDGGSLADPAAQTIQVNAPPAVAGLSQRIEMDATGVTVPDTTPATPDAMRAMFRQGKVAMILDYAASLSALVGSSVFPSVAGIGVAPVPAGSVTSSGPLDSNSYAIYAGSQNLTAAYDFVHFLASPQAEAELAARIGLLPARANAYANKLISDDAVVQAFRPIIASGRSLPQVIDSGSLVPPLGDALTLGLANQGSPQSLLNGVATQYARTLPGFTIGPSPAPS